MRRFNEILVLATPAPETPEIVRRAAMLAERNGARLTLFDSVPRLGSKRELVAHGDTAINLQDMLVDSRRRDLEDLAAALPAIPMVVDVRIGTPFIAVIERVIEGDHDLVITAPDRGGATTGLRGASTTLHLLRKCPCPVWVDDPQAWDRRDVLVAVGSPSEDGDIGELNQTLLELGSSLAQIQGGAVHLVHAWRLEGENIMRNGRVHLPAAEVDDLVDRERMAAEAAFDVFSAFVERTGVELHRHLVRGEPADVVSQVVAQQRPGVVVMGTLARAGLSGLIIGNTAERVLGELESSVMAVKPPGFESPVGRAVTTSAA